MNLGNRRTIRKFEQKPIEGWKLDEILTAGYLAPTSMNAQNVRIVLVQENLNFMFRNVKFAGYLDGFKVMPNERPTAFIVLGTKEDCPWDLGIVANQICAQAYLLGIGSCMMGSVNREKVKMKDGYQTQLAIALGYPKHSPKIAEWKGSPKYYIANGEMFVPKKPKHEIVCSEEALDIKQKFVIDIDGTICTQKRDYKDAQPIWENIEKVKKLAEEGNEIQYFTARGTETGIDWKEVTINQLKEWGLPNPENVLFGKPSADVYIDDRAMNAIDDKWQ